MEISQKYKTQEGNTRDMPKKKKVTCISYVSQKDWKIKIRNKDILNEDKCIVIKTKQETDKRSYAIKRAHVSPKV